MTICYPVLAAPGLAYSVQPGLGFCAPGYLQATGSVHTGADFNDVRGGNSDLGAPVYAVADGVVVSAAFYPTWGNIVLLHHPALGVWTQYAHLHDMPVTAGQGVRMGDQIGTIGRGAANRFVAHLHFEVRRVEMRPDNWPSTTMRDPAAAEAWIRARYLDPEAWLREGRALPALAQVEAVRTPVITAPPAAAPALPEWVPVYDPVTRAPVPGLWVSIGRRGNEFRVFRVPPERLKERGLK